MRLICGPQPGRKALKKSHKFKSKLKISLNLKYISAYLNQWVSSKVVVLKAYHLIQSAGEEYKVFLYLY